MLYLIHNKNNNNNMESKQTATDYLIQEIKNDSLVQAKSTQEWNEVFRKAKQMEREQIIDARQDGVDAVFKGYSISNEEYYNETYGGKDESNN